MEIREARAEDWPAIWAFMRPILVAAETYVCDPAMPEHDGKAWWMRTPPGGRTLVAVGSDDVVMGTAEMCPNHGGPGAHIANASFMVDPAYGGRGIGRALVKRTIDLCREDGYRAIQFNAVAETNKHAVRLYEDLGFKIIATIPEGFQHPTEGYVGLHLMYLSLR